MLNSPMGYIDPSGHKPCDDIDDSECYDAEKVLKIKDGLEKKYKIKIGGKWNEREIRSLRSTLSKLASALGGTDNLNAAIVAGAQKYDKNATHIAVERVAGARWNPTSSKPSVAAWCKGSSEESCSKNTIVFADDTFSSDYQFNTGVNGMVGPAYNRTKFTTDLDTAIQFTMAHEFGHVLSDANPIALKTYSAVWGGDDESMANELALQTISGGSQFAGWAFIYGFWDYTGRK